MKNLPTSPRRLFSGVIALVAVAMASVAWAGSSDGVLDDTHANVRAVKAVQGEVTPDLMRLDGILGTAVGLNDNDEMALVVFVDQDSTKKADLVRGLPPQIRGKAVKLELTDKFRAFKPNGTTKPAPTPTVDHKAKQTPPIQLGTSGGWSYDLANGYCCGGTLGSLIQVNGVQYILSNYHVFESDIVDGGNQVIVGSTLVKTPRTSATGDPIIQPGLIDVNCNVSGAQTVGTLVKLSALPNNNVDCSVAQVWPGMVRADGAILEIGTISKTTLSPSLRLGVKKSGRTTGLTTSTVSGLNATISVTYDNECAGGTAFTRVFTGQIVVKNLGSKFLAGGDSGSLMVENKTTNPKAVGLLYAGSSFDAIANPIDEVLSFIGTALGSPATMVGN